MVPSSIEAKRTSSASTRKRRCCVYFKGLHRVVVERCREDDVRELSLTVHQFFDYTEAVEAGHLDVEKDQIGRMFLDESESFDAVFALADEMDLGETFEEKREFVARGFFVVYDECVDRHDGAWTWAWSVYATGVLRST